MRTPHLKSLSGAGEYSPPQPPIYKLLSHRGTAQKTILSQSKQTPRQPLLNNTQKLSAGLPKSQPSKDLYSSKKGSEQKFVNSPMKSEKSLFSKKNLVESTSTNNLQRHS